MFHDRVLYIEELNNFISAKKKKLNKLLHAINWSEESLLSAKELQSGNAVFEAERSGLIDQKEFSPEGILNKGQVIILDMLYGNHLQTVGAGQLYNEIVASLQAAEKPVKNKKDVKMEDKAAALAQLLKMERDAKRRRISYKNKVHTKNKSHTEVLKEVLEEQMLTLTCGKGDDNTTCTNTNTHQASTKQTPELISMRPLHGNPHLAWLTIIEDEEERSKINHHSRSQVQKSEHISHRRESSEHKQRFRNEEGKGSKKGYHKDSFWKERKETEDKHIVKEKKQRNGWDERERISSPRNEEKHHKHKKKKRSHSSSPKSIPEPKRHKSKHKKKRH